MTWSERAERLIPGGVNTFSKAPSQFPANAPRYILRGSGSHVLGQGRREFIDWTAGLGAISLGYGDAEVDDIVKQQFGRGPIFGLPHPIELDFAEELASLLPWPDVQFRYGKNGSDATSGAVRAARAITRRKFIVSKGYHGWHDFACPNPSGIPDEIRGLTGPFLDHLDLTAAVIIEPDISPIPLEQLREECTTAGAMLIFDEVLTGFRVPNYTWTRWMGITPDLICLSKAIANGFPLSVIAGPHKYMEIFDGAIGYSMTFGGDTIGLAAGLATILKYKTEPVIERLWEIGKWIADAWNDSTHKLGLEIPLAGYNSRLLPKYRSLAERTLFCQEMVKREVLMTTAFFAMYAHTDEDVERTCRAIRQSLEIVASAGDHPENLVEGPIVTMPFRQMTSL